MSGSVSSGASPFAERREADPNPIVDRLLSLESTDGLLERCFPGQPPDESFAELYQILMRMFWTDPARALVAVRHLRTALDGVDVKRNASLARLEGHGLSRVGRSAEAATHYARAAQLFARAGESLEEARTSIGWSFALALAGKPREAEAVGKRGRALLAGRDRALVARIESNVATGWQLAGRFDRASTSFEKAFSALLAAGSTADAGLVAHNLGVLAYMTGRTDDAVAYCRKALELFGDDPSHDAGQAEGIQPLYSRTVLAAIDLNRGRWDEGLKKIAALREIFEHRGDARARGWLHRELALLFSSLGSIEAATPEADVATRVFEEGGLELDAAHVAVLHGHLLGRQGRLQAAAQRLQKARAHFEATGNLWQLHRVDLEQVRLHLEAGQTGEARNALANAEGYLQRTDPSGAGALSRALAAEIHLRDGAYRTAIRMAARAYREARSHPAKLERPRFALVAAEAHAALSEHSEAMGWVRRAVRELERNLIRFGTRRMRVLVGGARNAVYGPAVDLALRGGGTRGLGQAIDLLSRAGCPNLIESVEHRKLDRRSRETRKRDSTMRPDLRSAIVRLRDEMLTSVAPMGDESRASSFHAQIAALDKRLGASSVSPEAVRQAFDDRRFDRWSRRLAGRELVHYDRSSNGGWRAFLVRPDRSLHLVELPGAERALERSWFAFRMLVETAGRLSPDRREAFLARTQTESAEHLAELRRSLWDPIPWSTDRVVLVPHGELHAVPLEALDPSGGRIASRLPHPALLASQNPRQNPRQNRRRRSALLLSGPQPEMRDEVDEIGRVLRNAGFQVTQGDRREDLNRGGRVDVLHVASHGVFHPLGWLLSGLQLADGWFGLEQLRPKQLEGALVHLTSCESGRVGQLPGTDLEGWSTAALAAGARELVLAAWRIEGSSAHRFAAEFYERWARGRDAAAAVHETRADFRERYPHPYHWAAYLAVG